MKTRLLAGVLFTALAVPAGADRTSEDDLQLVRKAVASSRVAGARPPAKEPLAPRVEARTPKGELRWFRVRIEEKGGKRAKVRINLPLGLVRSFGDDWPIAPSEGCGKTRRCPTLGEILLFPLGVEVPLRMPYRTLLPVRVHKGACPAKLE